MLTKKNILLRAIYNW